MYSELLSIPPENLHYIYGVNCFQHAIGYRHPIIEQVVLDQNNVFVTYIALRPGSPDKPLDIYNPEEFKKNIIEACHDEGLVNCNDRFLRRSGYRTLALFFSEDPERCDYHFAFLNSDGKWETKAPFHKVITSTDLETASWDCKFNRFLLAPEDHIPKAIAEWRPSTIKIPAPSGNTIELAEISNECRGVFGNRLLFLLDQNIASPDRCTCIQRGVGLPLPAWHLTTSDNFVMNKLLADRPSSGQLIRSRLMRYDKVA
jgi:hypothetical protein